MPLEVIAGGQTSLARADDQSANSCSMHTQSSDYTLLEGKRTDIGRITHIRKCGGMGSPAYVDVS
jgi:hypothetical protein